MSKCKSQLTMAPFYLSILLLIFVIDLVWQE
ncbi:hypothetical protein RDI58_017622 [Solanum bulbocastanum]|uniref:Uncharacterized protein n=1 Tax=Solanum bulbocastanum TaxID=147425 RepID=A0AAN8YC67_SOLBU